MKQYQEKGGVAVGSIWNCEAGAAAASWNSIRRDLGASSARAFENIASGMFRMKTFSSG